MKLGEAEAIFPYASLSKVAVFCPGCGAENTSERITDRYGYEVFMARCRTCTLWYLAEQLTREGYDQLYAGKYRELVGAYSKHYSNKPRTEVNGFWLYVLREGGVSKIHSILDAGGSTGIIGQQVAQAYGGAALTILDPAAHEFPIGQHLRGYLEDPISGTYDLALCIDTMDHLTQPLRALANLRAVSTTLLLNYIDVGKRAREGCLADVKIDHPLYWNARAMQHVLTQTGWRIRARRFGRRIPPPHAYVSTVLVCEHASSSPKDA